MSSPERWFKIRVNPKLPKGTLMVVSPEVVTRLAGGDPVEVVARDALASRSVAIIKNLGGDDD